MDPLYLLVKWGQIGTRTSLVLEQGRSEDRYQSSPLYNHMQILRSSPFYTCRLQWHVHVWMQTHNVIITTTHTQCSLVLFNNNIDPFSSGLPTWDAQLKALMPPGPLSTRLTLSNYSSRSIQTHSNLQPVLATLLQP